MISKPEADRLLIEQAERLRAGNCLGKSPALHRLFDYLLQTSLEDRLPKEVEVASAVFSRDGSFDAMQDASVRVYAHRLRRKIDDYYTGQRADEPWRLTIPRGEYRLALVPAEAAEQPETAEPPMSRTPALPAWRSHWLIPAASLLIVILSVLTVWLALRPDRYERELAAVRASPLWVGSVIDDNRPIVVVLGDYYIFGEKDADGEIKRLVREFAINSHYELDEQIMQHPELNGRYADLGLRYYPLGVATALREVLPILLTKERRGHPLRVMPASSLTPEMLRMTNVVYIGYLSGLGMMRNPVFNGSRYTVGDSYDELVDKKTFQRFDATTGMPGRAPQREFAYIAKFRGPSGNTIIVIAGTRDAAMMQAADFASHAPTAQQLGRQANGAMAFEALLRVETLGDQNLAGKLLSVNPLDTSQIWRDGSSQMFPDDGSHHLP